MARNGPADVRKILICDKSESIPLLFNLLCRWWNGKRSGSAVCKWNVLCSFAIQFVSFFKFDCGYVWCFDVDLIKCSDWTRIANTFTRPRECGVRAHSPYEPRLIAGSNGNDKTRNAIAAPLWRCQMGFCARATIRRPPRTNEHGKLIWLYCKHVVNL